MISVTLHGKYLDIKMSALLGDELFKAFFYAGYIKDFASASGAEHKMIVD